MRGCGMMNRIVIFAVFLIVALGLYMGVVSTALAVVVDDISRGVVFDFNALQGSVGEIATALATDVAFLIAIAESFNPSLPPEQSMQIATAIMQYSYENGVPPILTAMVIGAESQFVPRARGRLDEIGLMQVRERYAPHWARLAGIPYEGQETLLSPEANIAIGTYMLGYLLRKYDFATGLALTAYNAGEGRVDRWLSSGGSLSQTYSENILATYHYYKEMAPSLWTAASVSVAGFTEGAVGEH